MKLKIILSIAAFGILSFSNQAQTALYQKKFEQAKTKWLQQLRAQAYIKETAGA